MYLYNIDNRYEVNPTHNSRKDPDLIINSKNFNLEHIADSGQCFRMNRMETGRYGLIAYDRYIELTQLEENRIELSCTEEEYNLVWKDYFDMDYDYSHIITGLTEGDDEFLKNAVQFGGGLRILRQEVFETLISFIISQRKNIPAIKNCIEQLCRLYGEKITDRRFSNQIFYTFPSPEKLAGAQRNDLRQAGLGYRDEYVLNTARAVSQGDINLGQLKELDREVALSQLLSLSGVGIKVANCVSLYGLHHIEAFPIDVWIARILKEIYHDNFNLELYSGYAGIVQQYMFYYMRSMRSLK